MSGFFGWFVIAMAVLAIFNAEKLPALRQMLEDRFKDSVDAAKEGAKTAKGKIEKVKAQAEARRNAGPTPKEAEENTPEETAEALRFMNNYINKNEPTVEPTVEEKVENNEVSAPVPEEEKPIDLEHRY